MRPTAILFLFALLGSAQIQDLVMTDDGAQTYFSTAYRQEGTSQPGYLKLFRIAEDGLQLFRQFDMTVVDANGDTNFYLANRPSVSGDGRVVAFNASAECDGGGRCVFFVYDEAFLAGSPDRPVGYGQIIVGPDGRSFLLRGSADPTINSPQLNLGDVAAGTLVKIKGNYNLIGDGRQALANGPVALLMSGGPVLWTPAQTTPLKFHGIPLNARLNAVADRIVYETASELHSYSVASGADLLLATGAVQPWITSDGTRVSYILNNQLYVQSTSGGPARALTDASDGVIVDAVISGWGNVAFAATYFGRLLRIDVATGAKAELIAPVPHLQVTFGQPAPGGRIDVTVTGPPDGDPAITGAGAVAPIVGRSDNVVTFQIPWEAALGSTVGLVVPGNRSELEEVHELQIVPGAPTFYSVAVHQDFSALVSDTSPAQPGEIVHVYATDLGAVSPPIATGAVTPTGTLYTLQTPLTCTFQLSSSQVPAQILFAGLAPGTIGVDQIDIVIPAQADGHSIGLICPSGQPIGTIPGVTQIPVAGSN